MEGTRPRAGARPPKSDPTPSGLGEMRRAESTVDLAAYSGRPSWIAIDDDTLLEIAS